MSGRGRKIVWGLVLAFISFYAFLEHDVRGRFAARQSVEPAVIVPNKALAPVMAMGFHNLWADFSLLNAQVFFANPEYRGRIEKGMIFREMIELATTLDPSYKVAYFFGHFALSSYWNNWGVRQANEILKLGWKNNFDDYRFPQYIGFNYYLNSENKNEIVKWFRIALRYPEAPRRLIWTIDRMLRGADTTNHIHAESMCAMCEDAKEKEQKRYFCERCETYTALIALNDLRLAYLRDKGRPIGSLGDLTAAGYIDKIPVCPNGCNWLFTADGAITSSSLAESSTDVRGVP
ncbi:MAG: hypothetical protein C4523_16640 [Myxococcales bacterium]|nr:MAG: hypothetical protein C4523_16640 [Myxococcales bacterium]